MMQPNQESSHYRNGNSGTVPNVNGGGSLVPAHNTMVEWEANTSATPSGTEGGAQIEPKALFNAFRRRWFMAVTVGLLCGSTAAAAVYLLVPPNYVAKSTIHIKSTAPTLLNSVQSGYQDFETFKKTQMYRAISRMVLDTALNEKVQNESLKKQGYKSISDLPLVKAQPDLMKIDWLIMKLKVTGLQEEFFQIQMEHSDRPRELAEIVNAITNVYLRDVANEDKTSLRHRIAGLEGLIITEDKKVQALRTSSNSLAKRLGVSTPEAISFKDKVKEEERATLSKQYMEFRNQLQALEIHNRIFQKEDEENAGSEDAVTDELLDAYVEQEPDLQRLVLQSLEYKNSIQILENSLTDPQHHLLVTKRKELAANERSIKEMRENLRPVVEERIRKEIERSEEFAKLPVAERIENLTRITTEMEKELRQMDDSAKTFTHDTFELDRMNSDKERAIVAVDDIKDRVNKLKIELDAPERIAMHEKAQVPRLKDMATLYKKSAMAGLGVFGLLVAGIVWFEFQAKRIDSLSDVTGGLSLRIMGALPQMPRWANKKTKNGKNAKSAFWHSVMTESIDAARTVLIRDANVESTRLVMIASAISGEGKTTLSSHLAASLARVGRNTILVDCDFRKANIHKVFGVEAKPGLSEVLLGTASLEEAIKNPTEDGPAILPAGEFNSQLLAALAQDGLGAIFQELKKKYEFVVVDSSPILPVTDSLMVAQHVDAVILSIRRDVSRRPKVIATRDKLAMLGVPVLGAVVIGLDGESYGYRAGYYGYGSRYGYGYQYNRSSDPAVKSS